MNAFQNYLKQEESRNEGQGGFGNSEERYQPKNEVLRLNKDVPEAIVRILPPIEQGSYEFAKEFRNTGINYNNKNGEQKFSGLTLPAEPGSSVIDPYITEWINNNVSFSRFPNKPGVRFYIHVLQYSKNQQGQLVYKQDEQGNPYIQPMEITQTAYKALLGKLGDDFLSPQNAPFSFISENDAYLVRIQKAKKGEMSWSIDVYSNFALGALPQNWREFTSDLDKLAQPTEETNPAFVNFLINKVNNTELSHDNFVFNRDTNKLGEAPTPKQEAPTQQQVDDGLPGNLQAPPQQTQQPVQQNQPQFNQQPQQQDNNPWGNVDTNNISDDDLPFGNAPQQPVQQPSQPQQSQSQPNQQNNQQPPQQSQQSYDAPASVDDVLAGLDGLDIPGMND